VSGVTSTNDAGAAPYTSGNTIIAGAETVLATSSNVASGSYTRVAGTTYIHSGTTLLQVDFHMIIDHRSTGTCSVFGSALPTA
jgi:hypothetical protein